MGLFFIFGAFSASAAWIPLEIGMGNQHPVYYTSKLSNFTRTLSWYDSDTTYYKVTYIDGHGKYHYRGTSFTSFSTKTEPTTYERLNSTERKFYDSFSVSGVHESRSMSGSITLRR
ncbi:hypothetical protein [Bacillus kwashiorkori]|uniref:hypothetical protein n=1 Tax=Bacillus kwashiorkori TaxID=1522318 RepID=UPI000781AB9D|nr:hypothetical protein [Bacillus kwashiorkori]